MSSTANSKDEIERQFAAAGIDSLSPAAGDQFPAFLELLLRWNARMNLTSVRAPEEIIRRHFVECAFAARHLPLGTSTLLDFGSGAGFPGIPIAICRPEIYVVLAESQAKKTAFLREALRTLAIPGEVYSSRVEAMPLDRAFDAVALRSVDKMAGAVLSARAHAKRSLALFVAQDGVKYQQLAPEFRWHEPIPLPSEKRSLLLLGHRK